MGAILRKPAKLVSVKLPAISSLIVPTTRDPTDDAQWDLEDELAAKKEAEDAEKQRLALGHVVENLFPYAPVKVQAQKYPTSTPKAGQTYLWVAVDEDEVRRIGGPPSPIRYPIGVAIDSQGNVFVSEAKSPHGKTASDEKDAGLPRLISSTSIVELANHGEVPPAPPAPTLVKADQHQLTIRWKAMKNTTIDRYEVQYRQAESPNHLWACLITVFSVKDVKLESIPSHTPFEFRVRCHNPIGWSDFSPVSDVVYTLPGIPTTPFPPIAGALADTYISMFWSRVNANGASPVTYTLEMRENVPTGEPLTFHRLYRGTNCGYVVGGLHPNTTHGFRLKAENSVGTTGWVDSKPIKTLVEPRPEIVELSTDEKKDANDRWVPCWDPKTEQVFYFNKFTSQRTTEEPPEVAQVRQDRGLGSVDETAEMTFRRKRFRFHRELRQSLSPSLNLSNVFPINVKRTEIFENTRSVFATITKQALVSKVKITFDGEAGIDSGGLTKDWYLELSKRVRTTSPPLFVGCDHGDVEINSMNCSSELTRRQFVFVGQLLAKAVFDRQTLELPLTNALLKCFVNVPTDFADLERVDAAFHASLVWLLANDVTHVIDETFSVETTEIEPKTLTKTTLVVDLKENGREIAVTQANKHEYVALLTQWRTDFAVRPAIDALLQGFLTLIPLQFLQSFDLSELKMLINGKTTIDVEELRAATVFQGGYDENAQVVLWLWQALREFRLDLRGAFLKFMTGTTRIPLDGFDPPLNLTKSDLDPLALPRTHTCFNQLVLPEYPTYETLVEKLTFAITNSEGFELS